MLPVMAGACYAMGSIITFRHLRDESPLAILMSFIVSIGVCGAVVTTAFTILPVPSELLDQAPFLFKGWQIVDDLFWLWILLIAVGASVALSLMTKAYQLAETSYLAIYEYAYLISVGLFGWIFWGIIPGIMSIIGIILIVFSGILIVIAQQRPKEKI